MSERGEYRAIARALIDGPDFQKLPADANHVFLLLKLNFGPTGIEVWYPDELLARLCRQSSLSRDAVMRALDVLEHEMWIKRADNVVWIVGQLEFDPHMHVGNPKHRAAIAHRVAGLPHIGLVREFVARNQAWFEGIDTKAHGIDWVSIPVPRVRNTKRKRIASPLPSPLPLPSPELTTCDAEAPPEEEPIAKVHWVRDGAEWWRANVGEIAEPKFGAMVKAAVDHHGWDVVFPAMRFYATHAPKFKTRNPKYFADEVARWIAEEADGRTLIGANGNEAEIAAWLAANPPPRSAAGGSR